MAATLGLVLTLTGCSASDDDDESDTPPTSTASTPRFDITEEDFAAVADLMDERAATLLAGDEEAFLATLDPGDENLREQQLTFFDNVQALPVDRLTYTVGRNGLPAADIGDGDPVLRPELVESLRLRGFLRRPIGNDVSITFVRRGDRWLVGSEALEEDLVYRPQARPWFGGPIEVSRAGPVMTLSDTDTDTEVDAGRLRRKVERSLAAVHAVLDTPQARSENDPVIVDATSNGLPTELSNASGRDAGAVSFPVFSFSGPGSSYDKPAGSFVKINPEDVDDYAENRYLLTHELTHFVLAGYTQANPQWATEGIAEYVAYQPGLVADFDLDYEDVPDRIAAAPVRLVPGGLWGTDPTLDYLIANATCEYLIETYGLAKWFEMMNLFEKRFDGVAYGVDTTAGVLRTVYGLTPGAVARGAFAVIDDAID